MTYDKTVERELAVMVAGTRSLKGLSLCIGRVRDRQRMVESFMKNRSIVSLDLGDTDEEWHHYLSLIVKANLFIA